MGQYDIQQVCMNGHQITDNYYSSPEFRKNFCTKCGAKTIKACPKCNQEIKGDYQIDGAVFLGDFPTPVPEICEHCGADFPWKGRNSKKTSNSSKEKKVDSIAILNLVCNKFHTVARQLRSRYNDRETIDIQDEYDVQDLLHALLRMYFEDIRPEEWNPSYAGSSTRSDFLLKEENILIEVKKTRKGLKAKDLGKQLVVDIAHYQNHPNCKLLYCFVYDPDGYISNPRGIENDLNQDKELKVIVNIVPKNN